jgi:hypothetical protein
MKIHWARACTQNGSLSLVCGCVTRDLQAAVLGLSGAAAVHVRRPGAVTLGSGVAGRAVAA